MADSRLRHDISFQGFGSRGLPDDRNAAQTARRRTSITDSARCDALEQVTGAANWLTTALRLASQTYVARLSGLTESG
jgi:hypothetical protein